MTTNLYKLYALGDSEGSPFEQAPSATMETLLPYQSSLGNIQIRDNPDLAGKLS